jgi:uncharacterized protein (TIGR03437 family)
MLRLFLSVSPTATPGAASIQASNAVATGPDGSQISLQATAAAVHIQPGTSTATFPPGTTLNAASLSSGPVSPGEIITILGVSGASSTTLLSVNGVNAPILYSGLNQVNAVIPFGLDVSGPANIVIQQQGYPTSSASLPAAPVAPAIFTQSSNGTGPGAILNQDFTINSYSNPAPAGSVIMIYGTGFGMLNPPPADGQPVNGNAKTSLPVTAFIGGHTADVLYAGAAPGLIAGVVQINVRVPYIPPGPAAPVSLSIGSVTTPPGVTVSTK